MKFAMLTKHGHLNFRLQRLSQEGDLNNPEPPLHGVGEQEAALGPHTLILIVDEPGHLPQTLLIVSLRAEKYDIGSQARHAS